MGMDWFIPARQDNGDESLADFIGRRMGQEAVDKLAEPLMAGIYNAAAENLSVMATFPRFRAMEVKYGSLIRGMLAGSKAMKAAAAKNPNGQQKKLGAFVTFNQGTDVIIKALAEQLKGDMRLNCAVDQVETHEDDTYRLHLSDGSVCDVDQIILAVPAYNAAQLIRPLASQAADFLETIRYVSTGTVSLAYRTADMERPLNGHGVVIPRSEGRRINAITWTSTKFDHRAPEGYCLVRAFIGGSRTPEMLDKTDDEIAHIVRDEFRDIMGLTAEPLFHRIYRWPRSTPQYDVGHLERVAAVERHLPPGVHITGRPYRGIGMPDCVRQGKETAEQIVALMREEAPTLQDTHHRG
jgi:oxygen-dependent protoporphyrinogen oxidase